MWGYPDSPWQQVREAKDPAGEARRIVNAFAGIGATVTLLSSTTADEIRMRIEPGKASTDELVAVAGRFGLIWPGPAASSIEVCVSVLLERCGPQDLSGVHDRRCHPPDR
jgi:hypothetical protein